MCPGTTSHRAVSKDRLRPRLPWPSNSFSLRDPDLPATAQARREPRAFPNVPTALREVNTGRPACPLTRAAAAGRLDTQPPKGVRSPHGEPWMCPMGSHAGNSTAEVDMSYLRMTSRGAVAFRRMGRMCFCLLAAAATGGACAQAGPGAPQDAEFSDGLVAEDAGDAGQEQDACVPGCEGRECGDDGCGDTCGTCPGGRTCNEATGRCEAEGCEDECLSAGLTACLDAGSYHECGDTDGDPCYEWKAPENCPAGTTCSGGVCVPQGALEFLVRTDRETGGQVRPVWNRLNVWDVTLAPDAKPYPFYEEAVLMTATGGRDTNEMYHEDANGRPTYDFSALDQALDNLTNAGIRPIVVIGNTPRALSDRPDDQGAFDANTGAPTDYAKYRNYVTALASHLLTRYGTVAVRNWDFRLMTEPDNRDWWYAGMAEYQRLYDYTLAGLRLGGLNVPLDVGNYMTPTGAGSWTGPMAAWLASQPNPQTLFSDDFNDGNMDGWVGGGGPVTVTGGALDVSRTTAVTSQSFQDFRYSAHMTTLQPGLDPWLVGWLLFRYQDWDNFYAVGLHADGYLELARKVAGQWQGLLQVSRTSLDPAQPHEFVVEAEGDTVRVWVDGTLSLEYGAPGGPAAGAVGVWAWACDHVQLDDVRVETLSAYHPEALPRQARRVSFSCYARGQMGTDPRELATIVQGVRQLVTPHLGNVLVSVDEGQILFDEQGRYLWLGDGTELGAAWNAAIFKVALDVDLERYVQWGYTSGERKSPTYNVIEMYRMIEGGSLLETSWTGTPAVPGSYVDGLAARLPGGKTGVILFVYQENRNTTGDQPVAVQVSGLAPASRYTLEHYRVDRDHSNFFTQWLQDSAQANIQLHPAGGREPSPYDMAVPMLLSSNDGGLQFWNNHQAAYDALDDLELLEPASQVVTDENGSVTILVTLPQNAVSLLLLTP